MKRIEHYFPELTELQKEQFELLLELFPEWNSKINMVSRKDIDQMEIHHVLHAMSISKLIHFKADTDVLDLGTGGGFPGLPLAILFPETRFHLVDSIGKKIKVVNELQTALGLKNVLAQHKRAEELNKTFDFVISRAVADLSKLKPWVKGMFKSRNQHHFKNGLLLLKGGDLTKELEPFGDKPKVYDISEFYSEAYFETKKIVYMRMKN
ncbi:MAG: 16S rRNA (guanine(527)-N(7))-methyltransferase RsmG [Flavobacteriales bacterium]